MYQRCTPSLPTRTRKNLGPIYEICMTTGEGCDPDEQWLEEMIRRYKCSECRNLLIPSGPIDAVVCWAPPPSRIGRSIVNDNDVDISIIHRDLLDLLGEEDVSENLWVGQVIHSNGKVLDHLATIRGKEVLYARGNAESKPFYRECGTCGTKRYVPMGKRYILTPSLTGRSIYETDLGGLAVTETVRKRLGNRKWYGTGIYELPILDEPLDGLGPLPNIRRDLPSE